jgi:hypothetical protein
MGCSGGKEQTVERPGFNKLTVWGDYFNSDTRTILAILYIAGVQHNFEEVNLFKGQNKEETYIS